MLPPWEIIPLEAVDLNSGKTLHRIKGLDEPQGIGYVPQTKELLVANGGNGDCYFYNVKTFEKTGSIHLIQMQMMSGMTRPQKNSMSVMVGEASLSLTR